MLHRFQSGMKEFYATLSWRYRLLSKLILARLHRLKLTETQFIGITGSAGKTTTKELCTEILSNFYPVMCTPQSMNTPIIIAETMLATEKRHKFCIMELGAFKPGALDLPMKLFRPRIGVLTNIEKDHYRAFKGRGIDGIAQEKSKLIEALPKDGIAVLNLDDPRVKAIGARCKGRIIGVGRSAEATIKLCEATSRWPDSLKLTIEYQGKSFEVLTQLHGVQLAMSVLAALGVAIAAGLSIEEAIDRLAQVAPTDGRMQIITGEDGVVFIRDDMKAPLWSLQAPVEFLKEATGVLRKIIVVGSISDFSGDSSMVYKRCARELKECADLVVFIGNNAHRALRARKDEDDQSLQGFSTLREASAYLQATLRPGDLVLLKGSNKSDHLLRILLDRYRPIQCWLEHCGLDQFCDSCSRLYQENPMFANTNIQVDGNTTPASESTFSISKLPEETNEALPVIVGLGNPGQEYEKTLHNVGYQILDKLATYHGGVWQNTEEGQVCSIVLDGFMVTLFKPSAYMNQVGPKIRQYLARTGCLPKHCLVVYDDLDIEFGKIRFKRDGSDAGHLGIRSCLQSLETHAFPRLRFGVRFPEDNVKAKELVLTQFSKEAQQCLPQLLDQAIIMITQVISELGVGPPQSKLS
ncbi:aminoacyl-tRNA hydrolase [Nitrosomonas sp.]|uniref:aminoacyl-tRNA hydrolase n=1 Tax=Nitrosomonas sp. TaxID=42353 RepID=UPI00262F1171|nr:aminoacyl-tRNA hydrolase [Nitrosomonas sp.]MCW5601302.1 aminoacyl-tRNA hydrolase [Nitrosomonas sp.]